MLQKKGNFAMNKRKLLTVILGLTFFTCIFSLSPFWVNQCSHQLTDADIAYLMQKYVADVDRKMEIYEEGLTYTGIADENEREGLIEEYRQKLGIEEYQERLNNAYIPCGSNNLAPEEKEEAARRRLRVLDLLYDEPGAFPLPVRLDLEFVHRGYRNQAESYHFVGYTVFYIPILRAWGGGSGYYEICGFSSDCGLQQK